MDILIACIVGSVAASVITTKILATRYFNIVDGYINDMINKIGETIGLVESIVHDLRVKKGV